MSALPAATSLGGSLGSAGAISSTSSPAAAKKPRSRATISGAWSGLTNQSSISGELVGGQRRRPPAARPSTSSRRAGERPSSSLLADQLGAGQRLRLPGHQRAASAVDGQVQRQRHGRQHDQGREHQVDLHAGVGVQHEVAEPGAGADPLADHGPDRRHGGGDAQARGQRRQGRGHADLAQDAPGGRRPWSGPARASRARCGAGRRGTRR